MAALGKSDLSEYERQREQNIAENQKLLESLELAKSALAPFSAPIPPASAATTLVQRPVKPRVKPKPRVNRPSPPRRASNRLRGLKPSGSEVAESAPQNDTAPDLGQQLCDDGHLRPAEEYFASDILAKAIYVDGQFRGWLSEDLMIRYGFESNAKDAWEKHGGGKFSFRNPLGEPETSKKTKGRSAPRKRTLPPGWSSAKFTASKLFQKNPNAYFYRHNEPSVDQHTGDWTEEEAQLFLDVARRYGCGDKWGLFASYIPHRVGYQCSNYYRQVVLPQGWVIDSNYRPTSASDSDPSTNDAQDSVEATNNKLLHQVLEKVGKRRKTPKKLSELKGTMAQYTKMATLLSSEFDQPPQVTVADVDRFNPLGQSHSTSLRTRMLFEGQWKNAVDSLSQAFVADQLRAYIANHSKHLSPRTREKSLGKCAKAKLIDIIMREIWKLKRSKDEMDRAITKRKTTMAPTSKTLTIDRALYTLLGFKNTLLQVGLKTVTEIQPMAQDQLLQLTPIIGDESPAPVQLTIAGTQQNVGVATRALQAIRDGISETICIIDPAAGFTATDPTLRQLLIQVCQACSVIVRVKAESGLTLMFSSLGQRDAMAAKRMLLAFVDQ
ncbi:hypothetical protein H4R35_006293, partial [Dimargaris xerosporica]